MSMKTFVPQIRMYIFWEQSDSNKKEGTKGELMTWG